MPHDTAPLADRPAAADTRAAELTQSLHRSSGSFELAFAPVIMALLGLWLDRTFGTTPLFVVLLAVIGVVGAGISVFYSYRHQMASLERGPLVAPSSPATVDGAA
ncbi:MAG: AtpZ/AtpI family protein [Microthrixaceae bacterium]